MENENIDDLLVVQSIVFRDDDAFFAVDYFNMLLGGNRSIREKIEYTVKHVLDTTTDSSIREKYLYLERKLQQMGAIYKG